MAFGLRLFLYGPFSPLSDSIERFLVRCIIVFFPDPPELLKKGLNLSEGVI